MNKRMFSKSDKKLFLGVAAVLLVIVCALIIAFGSAAVPASAQDNRSASEKNYESILIHQDDTLWSIAERYAEKSGCSKQEYIETLKMINGLSSDLIITGTHLIIYY